MVKRQVLWLTGMDRSWWKPPAGPRRGSPCSGRWGWQGSPSLPPAVGLKKKYSNIFMAFWHITKVEKIISVVTASWTGQKSQKEMLHFDCLDFKMKIFDIGLTVLGFDLCLSGFVSLSLSLFLSRLRFKWLLCSTIGSTDTNVSTYYILREHFICTI